MAAYYNEIEPYAAQWLRNLIAAGHIAAGDVDERSIADVQPEDLEGYTQCHFFAGLGGWGYALRLAMWRDDRPVWTGSCPCQPFSVAGKQRGEGDPRHLWPHFFRLIAACRPPVVFGEQVAGAAGYGWLDGVRADLESEVYACEAFDIPACAVDAPHIRSRLYWVAQALDNAAGSRCSGQSRREQMGSSRHETRRSRFTGRSGDGYGTLDNTDHARLEGHAWHGDGRREWPSEVGSIAAASGGDMAYAHLGEPRARRRNDGEVCSVSEAQRQPEHGAAVSAGGGQGDLADAEIIAEREPHNDIGAVARQDARLGSGGSSGRYARPNGTFWSDHVWLTGADGKARRAQPGLPLLAHGVPARVGRLRAYGNAIVPQLAAEFIRAADESLNDAIRGRIAAW